MSEVTITQDATGERFFAEVARSGYQQRFQLRASLWEGRSPYQHVEIVDTVSFGRALVLDDALQTTEADEYLYHEPLVQIPLLAHPHPRRVLIVGGGDGGALRHALMHETVERAVQVEIDRLVVDACQEWLPGLADGAFQHPRAELIIGDGLAYMRDVSEPFDVILVDSTDPVGPAEGLISEEFYRLAAGALARDGIFAMQTGSPLLMRDELDAAAERMRNVFPIVKTYLGHVPSYPGVLWSWTAGSMTLDPSIPRRSPPAGLRYYTPDVHRAAFALPAYLQPASPASPKPPSSKELAMPLVAPPSEARFWGSGSEGEARFCLFGAPLDLTGSGRLGTGKAPPAVRRASHNIESYSPRLDGDLFDAGLLDLGDLALDGLPMEQALAEIERQTADVLARPAPSGPGNVVPIVVGGEHTIALAVGRAVKRRYPDAVIISLDAHLDLADELDGRKIAHGTWACRLGEELGGFGDFVLLGMRSGTRDEWDRSKFCLWQSPDVVIPDELGAKLADRPIYLSVDIDVLDPSAAPGTGTPEPPGISSADLFRFLYSLEGLNVVALDVNEILPEVDPAGITAITGAKLIREAAILLSH